MTDHGSTYDAEFGYQNDNAGVVEIPVGSANHFAPAPADRGQTTAFQPGNIQHAFTVTGIPSAQEAAWSVTNASVTRVADATASYQEKCSQPPQPAVPIGIFACVTNHGSTYDVTFGYENDNGADVSVPVSSANFVEPAPINRGQPELFAPGKVTSAFTVRGVANAGTIAWALSFRGTTVLVVTRSFPVKCGAPGRELAVVPVPLCIVRSGSTYTAVFGYVNQNPGAVVVPVGASNGVVPAPVDHGQPSVFRAGSVFIAFVSKNVPVGRAISWIVKSAGETKRATASASLGRNCALAPRINLALVKSATPTSVLVGDRVTYTIVVRNRGALTAQAATVVDRPPTVASRSSPPRPREGRAASPTSRSSAHWAPSGRPRPQPSSSRRRLYSRARRRTTRRSRAIPPTSRPATPTPQRSRSRRDRRRCRPAGRRAAPGSAENPAARPAIMAR